MKSLVILLFCYGVSFGQDVTTATTSSVIPLYSHMVVSDETDDATSVEISVETNVKGLMYNYKIGKIGVVNFLTFDESDAAIYLIQSQTVLEAYKWMRGNRKQYSIVKCVELVNKWWKNKDYTIHLK